MHTSTDSRATHRWWLSLLLLAIVAASPQEAVAEIHVVATGLSNSGFNHEGKYTEWDKVKFRITVNGVYIETWVGSARAKGRSSWITYYGEWTFECAQIAAGEGPKGLPESVSARVCGECDPSAVEDYERKKKVNEELMEHYLEQGERIRHETNEEISHATEEFLGLTGVIEAGGQIPGRVEWLKGMNEARNHAAGWTAAQQAAARKAPHSPTAKDAIAASYLKLALWYYELYDIIHRKLRAEASQDEIREAARKTWESALADFRRSLEQSRACTHQRARAEAHERLRHEMRELIDDWEKAGWRYEDPETKELLNVNEALHRAREILTSESESSRRITTPMAAPVSWTPGIVADAGAADFDAEAFVRELDRAMEQFEIGIDKLIRREEARVAFQKELETWMGRLQKQ